MAVRQLEEFLGQADQKGFWIFTYANLGGGFFGAFAGNSLLERTAPSLKLLGIVLGVVLGVLITWKVKGYPIYRWALSYVLFLLRRYLKLGLGASIIDAGLYYRSRAVRKEPFMLVSTRDGKPVPVLVHRGSGTGSSASLFDGPLLPFTEETALRFRGPTRSVGSHASGKNATVDLDISNSSKSPKSSNGRSSLDAIGGPPDPDYSEWEL